MQERELIIKLYALCVFLAISLGACLIRFFWLIGKGHYRHFHEKQDLVRQHHQLNIEEGERVMMEISREVHDNIAHNAVLMRILVNEAAKKSNDAIQHEILKDVNRIVIRMIEDATDISHSLNKDHIATEGLESMINTMLRYLQAYNNITCNVEVVGNIRKVPPQISIVLYRIVQEAVQNIVKHAKATDIIVVLSYITGRFFMSVKDNGNGFIPEEKSGGGIGLSNMRVRASYLKAEFNIESAPAAGTTIRLEINNVDETLKIIL